MPTVHCPKCSNTDIREANTAYTELGVLAWDFDEEGGIVSPSAYDTDNDPEWETARDGDPYTCGSCEWEGEQEELIVKEG